MSLIRRTSTPNQIDASRVNGRRSRGPAGERGKAVSSRNALKPVPLAQVALKSLEVLGERGEDLARENAILADAMQPRDAWEEAWIRDIALLRWRLARLERAEAAVMALRRRKLRDRRRRAAMPPTGDAVIERLKYVGLSGLTGIPDSMTKFSQVLEVLNHFRAIVAHDDFGAKFKVPLNALYGEVHSPRGALLEHLFVRVVETFKAGDMAAGMELKRSLLADLDSEIRGYEQLQSTFHAEHVETDPVEDDAELLLPSEELEKIIRYESHLEDQIERKLRQFYGRRREAVYFPVDSADPGATRSALRAPRLQGSSEGGIGKLREKTNLGSY